MEACAPCAKKKGRTKRIPSIRVFVFLIDEVIFSIIWFRCYYSDGWSVVCDCDVVSVDVPETVLIIF